MKVLSNLATSLDGKIAPAGPEFAPIGTTEDRRRMVALRAQADCILFGASTLRAYQRACTTKNHPLGKIWNVVLSSNLENLDPTWPFFQDERIHRILFHTQAVSSEQSKKFESSCKIIKIPGEKIASEMLAECSRNKIQTVIVEGGGSVMWHFVKENLIDEYHLTLTPKIIGGTQTPTLVDGIGLNKDQMLSLKLDSLERVGDELFLVYRKEIES